jgi:hypothetical protein
MITFLIIFLIGCLWITRDIIRVPEVMHDSWFRKYEGNKFIDPQVSWINKGDIHTYVYFLIVCFSDLFHLLGTAILFLAFLLIYLPITFSMSFGLFILLAFGSFGGGVWLFYQLWRKMLKPSETN